MDAITGGRRSQPRRHPIDQERITRGRAQIPSPDAATQIAALFSLIADPTRARLVYTLQQVDELCVGDLGIALQLGEDKIGYALRLLRTAGVLTRRRAGRVMYYRLADDAPPLLRGPLLAELLTMPRFTCPNEAPAAGSKTRSATLPP